MNEIFMEIWIQYSIIVNYIEYSPFILSLFGVMLLVAAISAVDLFKRKR